MDGDRRRRRDDVLRQRALRRPRRSDLLRRLDELAYRRARRRDDGDPDRPAQSR